MKVEQFVMAYQVEQDRIRAMLPEGFTSLRPVMRINAEIRDGQTVYLEFNTPVESEGKRGWLNIDCWNADSLSFTRDGKAVTFSAPFLHITFTRVGIEGGCPAEKDNDGCFFPGRGLRLPEPIHASKEFCDCDFAWRFSEGNAHGVSIGKTLPAHPEEPKIQYQKQALTAPNAAALPCKQVLGSYVVIFDR